MTTFFLQTSANSTLQLKDYFSLLGPALIIITFSIDRIIAYRIKKKEVYRNFYMKAIIEPSLEKIESFFDETLSIFTNGFTKLKALGKESQDYKKHHIKINEKFQDEKRKFEFHVIFPAEATIENLFTKLSPLIIDLEDSFINNMDTINSPNDTGTEFRNSLTTIKSKFILELYNALSFKTDKPNNNSNESSSGILPPWLW